jgi:DNA excision repair protein ERCC-2
VSVDAQGYARIDLPGSVERAVERLFVELGEHPEPLTAFESLRTFVFEAARWSKAVQWRDADNFAVLLHVEGRADKRDVAVKIRCLDPGPYINSVLGRYGGHVRFSATLSPTTLFQRLHGQADGVAVRSGAVYDSSQLAVLTVTDVPTYFDRREESLPRLVETVRDVVAAREGTYFVAFASYAYAFMFEEAYGAACPNARVMAQTTGMDDEARRAFLTRVAQTRPEVVCVVLGGIFTESIELAISLSGVIVVGVGYPPPTFEREQVRAHFDDGGEDGHTIAYEQPAMTKVVQAAGRVLRSAADRGVLCLIDPRFSESRYRRFFPSHWRPDTVRARDVGSLLGKFWSAQAH